MRLSDLECPADEEWAARRALGEPVVLRAAAAVLQSHQRATKCGSGVVLALASWPSSVQGDAKWLCPVQAASTILVQYRPYARPWQWRKRAEVAHPAVGDV